MMHNPPHPSEVLNDEVISPFGLSVKDAAERLGMSRVALCRVLNGKAAMSSDLAIRLEMAGSARSWIMIQVNYDLWVVQQHDQPAIKPFNTVAA